MKLKDLTPKDCETKGVPTRKSAIWDANVLTRERDRQHNVVKIDGLWYVYDATKHR